MIISNIQLLRAFAALNVVLFHIILTAKLYGLETNWIAVFEGWGANGVDVFFVISGFIMVYVQKLKQKNSLQFAIGRISRVAPVYWVLTLLLVSVMFASPSALNSGAQSFSKIMTSLLFLSKISGHGGPTLYVGWTLEYEMLFYLIFAGSLLLKNQNYQFAFTVSTIILLTIFTSIDPIIIEFVFGMFLAKLFISQKFKGWGKGLLAVGFIAFFASIPFETTLNRVIIWGIPAALIVHASCNVPQIRNKFLLHLGNASYSTYLVQVFSIPVFYKVCSHFSLTIPTDILAILCLVFTAALGSAVFIIIENPMQKFFKKTQQAKANKPKTVNLGNV